MNDEELTIELDCPPGPPRPGDLLPGVLEGTDVIIDPKNTTHRVMGEWGWKIPPEQREQYLKARPLIGERIKQLYDRGLIRYGSW